MFEEYIGQKVVPKGSKYITSHLVELNAPHNMVIEFEYSNPEGNWNSVVLLFSWRVMLLLVSCKFQKASKLRDGIHKSSRLRLLKMVHNKKSSSFGETQLGKLLFLKLH